MARQTSLTPAIKHAHDLLTNDLIGKENIAGTGVGHKQVNDQSTGVQSLIVFVKEKYQSQPIKNAIPKSVNGIVTDVISVGHLTKQSHSKHVRPITPGCSVGHGRTLPGTLGGIFYDKHNQVVALSNNHVLADENEAAPGDPIYQPSPHHLDCTPGAVVCPGLVEPIADLYCFATLKDFERLSEDDVNHHDSAIAVIPHQIVDRGLIDNKIPAINQATVGFGSPHAGQVVKKYGQESGLTKGKVIATACVFDVAYGAKTYRFDNCVVTNKMSEPGDSGSLLLNESLETVGLLFAGSSEATIFNDMSGIIARYGLKPWVPERIELSGRRWQKQSGNQATITKPNPMIESLVFTGPENVHNYIESGVTADLTNVSCIFDHPGAGGSTWGPCICLVTTGGTIKLNIRHSNLAVTINGSELIRLSTVDETTKLELQIKRGDIGLFYDDKLLLSTPTIGTPVAVRIGRVDMGGGASDHGTTGPSRSFKLRDVLVSSAIRS